jgi:hypothetical protein
MLQYDKLEINIPGTNLLNWRYARSLLNDTLIDKILAYSHKGIYSTKFKGQKLVQNINGAL